MANKIICTLLGFHFFLVLFINIIRIEPFTVNILFYDLKCKWSIWVKDSAIILPGRSLFLKNNSSFKCDQKTKSILHPFETLIFLSAAVIPGTICPPQQRQQYITAKSGAITTIFVLSYNRIRVGRWNDYENSVFFLSNNISGCKRQNGSFRVVSPLVNIWIPFLLNGLLFYSKVFSISIYIKIYIYSHSLYHLYTYIHV